MNTIKIYRLDHHSCAMFQRLQATRQDHGKWPSRNQLQKATKGRFALHSQSIQMVVHAFLANVETTRQLKPKQFYPVTWPAQGVCKPHSRVLLPIGRNRLSLVLPLDLPANSGACTLVWNNGLELHVCLEVAQAEASPSKNKAIVDLGEIHLAAVTTNTGQAMMVTGRTIRSLKRPRTKQVGQLAKRQSRCKKDSRRWKKLQRAKNKLCRLSQRRVRDMRHKATRAVIDFCVENEVGSLFIGNPHGVRNRDCGRHQNQCMSLWEYGKDINYLTHKAKQSHIARFTGSERGTSSRCPICGHRSKPKGGNWVCRACRFTGHRDLVGSVNMHPIAYGTQVMFPRSVTYLRPGLPRRSSRADTLQHCLSQSLAQPLLLEQVSVETGHTRDVAEKPVSL